MVRARLLAGCKRRGFDGYQCQALPIPTHNSGFSGLPLLAYSHPLCVAHPCVLGAGLQMPWMPMA